MDHVFALLIVTAIRMATHDDAEIHIESNPIIRLVRRIVPVSNQYHGRKFLVRDEVGGRVRTVATPLLIGLP